MPRVPDTPCSICAELMWSSREYPRGTPGRVCQQCRRVRTAIGGRAEHGTMRRYKFGCRCDECRAANAARVLAYHHRRRLEGRPVPRGPRPTYTITCEFCGLAAEASKQSVRFCSLSCSGRALAGWSRSTEIVYSPRVRGSVPVPESSGRMFVAGRCRRCGEPFTIVDQPTNRYCSKACAEAEREDRRRARKRIFVSGPCRRCGESFTVLYQLTSRYCSTRCLNADTRDRRRARKRGAYVENVYRKKIFERDGWRCQICRKTVDRTKVAPHPRAPTLDHIIPLAQGGTHEPSNCQLACFRCNSLKGDRIGGVGDQLRLIG